MNPSTAGDKAAVNDFRKMSLLELRKIKEAWPRLNYGLARGVLIVEPSVPSVPSLPQWAARSLQGSSGLSYQGELEGGVGV